MLHQENKKIRKTLWSIFKNQKERGVQGAGLSIYRTSQNTIERLRFKKPGSVINHAILKSVRPGDFLLFHHRLPTSTPNIKICNHPISNEKNTIHLIHNGWISGADRHFKRQKQNGHQFDTEILQLSTARLSHRYFGSGEVTNFTDSEVIVHELEDNLDRSDMVTAIEDTVDTFFGSLTFAFIIKGVPAIHLYRGDNPCSVFKDTHGNVWFASLFPKRQRFELIKSLSEGEIARIDNSGFHTLKTCDVFGSLDGHLSFRDGIYSGISFENLRNKQEVVYDVVDFINSNFWYHRRGISVYDVADLLSAEFESSQLSVSQKEIYKLASDIWENM